MPPPRVLATIYWLSLASQPLEAQLLVEKMLSIIDLLPLPVSAAPLALPGQSPTGSHSEIQGICNPAAGCHSFPGKNEASTQEDAPSAGLYLSSKETAWGPCSGYTVWPFAEP